MSTIPVLVKTTRHNDVEVCELIETEHGIGLSERAFYFRLGGVAHRKVRKHIGGRNVIRDEWVWTSEGFTGAQPTKEKAVAAMLADAGYREVTIEATIAPLF